MRGGASVLLNEPRVGLTVPLKSIFSSANVTALVLCKNYLLKFQKIFQKVAILLFVKVTVMPTVTYISYAILII